MATFRFDIELESLTFIINHIFLPPKLPQKADADPGEHNSVLLKLCLVVAEEYQSRSLDPQGRGSWELHEMWVPAVKMLGNFSRLDNQNSLDAHAFRRAVKDMRTGDVVALHIAAQNAGLILHETRERMIFQSFEASPLTAEVLKPVGKLRCSYPGPAIAVSLSKAKNKTFLRELSSFLEKVKRDTALAQNKHTKGASTVNEERESAHPKFISELLTGILRGIGEPATVQRFEKRIGDEVLWDNARIPWRRSPLWLVLRVALQTTMMIHGSQIQYKLFMVYLITKILQLAMRQNLGSDILFVMNAKLSRRVSKMMGSTGEKAAHVEGSKWVFEEARLVGDSCARKLEHRWNETRTFYSRSLSWSPWTLKPAADTRLSMPNCEEYIKWARSWGHAKPERKPFNPQEGYRVLQFPQILPAMESLSLAPEGPEMELALADVELWVRDHLGYWVSHVAMLPNVDATCDELGRLIQQYIKSAKVIYNGNPERMSVFYLTLMEMWIALDTLVIELYPLLADYSPYYFTDGFLNPLLLPEPQQRERLQRIEEYLRTRKQNSQQFDVQDNVFSDTPTSKSFSVRYFDQNYQFEALRQSIIENAFARKQQKRIELQSKILQQENLKEQAHHMECQYFTHWEQGWTRHHNRCQKCLLIKDAEKIRVEVFEWPLPEDEIKSKAAVFELCCPQGFSVWRDTTYRILAEVSANLQSTTAKTDSQQQPPFEYLENFAELRVYHMSNRVLGDGQQLHWASSTKSFAHSHYRFAKLPTDLNSVCVKNSLTFGLYDQQSKRWVDKDFGDSNIRGDCTYKLPDGPYKHLQFSLRYLPYSPNQIIAKQSDCPPEIQLNEYIAFGLVRSGRRVQWLNMLRELRTKTLTFNNEAVNMLFNLCAWQSGPPGDGGGHREAHVHLKEEEFRQKLLTELYSMLESIKSNWQEAVTARTLIILACQLLMFSNDTTNRFYFRNEVVSFLRRARAVCVAWARDLANTLHDCENPQEIRSLQLRVVQIAAICRETYNVAADFLNLLLHTKEDFAILVECATIIHDNISGVTSKLEPPIRFLLERDKRLAHAIEGYVRQMIIDCEVRLDLSRVWESYDGSSCKWHALENPNQRWITASVMTGSGAYQEAHYNILTGRLLVDGLPLGRMPSEYISDPVYKELLGEKLLDVYPASIPGMTFQTRRPINGTEVAFALDESELVIRSITKERQTYHLIPKSKLKGEFPAHIIDQYVFWYHLGTGKIELRERNKTAVWFTSMYPYISSPNDSSTGHRHLYFTFDNKLIDVNSDTAKMIHSVLNPLEYNRHIEVRWGKGQFSIKEVSARLPRLKLDFFVNKTHDLECRQFSRMVVDRNQNLDTLIGLDTKLIVRQGSVRSLFVPYGTVTFRPDDKNHVSVEISTNRKGFDRVKYHIYTIDDTLGRLVANGSLASHLYKVFLHAVTSSCMPDPLTGRTGTEEALALLRSAATWSFQRLDKDGVEAELLKLIAGLSPTRVFYPRHLKCMQQITWNPLSPLSQHESFEVLAQSVFYHAESLHMFTETQEDQKYYKPSSDYHLSKRAAFRNTKFRRDEFLHTAEKHASKSVADHHYTARDSRESLEEARVHYTATLVEAWPTRLTICENLLRIFMSWTHLDNQPLDLGYDERLLEIELADVWFDLQQSLIDCSYEQDMYKLMFTFSTLAYSGRVPQHLIETLLAFATVPDLRRLGLPKLTIYDLSDGFVPDPELLFARLRECAIDFMETDEANFPPLPFETDQALALRRSEAYRNNLHQQISSLVDRLVDQWPCEFVTIPAQSEFRLISMDAVGLIVRPLFLAWYENMGFEEYMAVVQYNLNRINVNKPVHLQHYRFTPYRALTTSEDEHLQHETVLARPHPILPATSVIYTPTAADARGDQEPKFHSNHGRIIHDLSLLLESFSKHSPKGDSNRFVQEYASHLDNSFRALRSTKVSGMPTNLLAAVAMLEQYKAACAEYLRTISGAIQDAVVPKPFESGWMIHRAGLWPQLSPVALLQRLAASTFEKLTDGWKEVLVQYGVAITMLQRAERLLRLAPRAQQSRGSSDFLRELDNIGHQGWDPRERPDWLLMEIENNVLVRSVQAEVARTMTAPPKNNNTIMQLLMGEGKTSIIVPIVATALADGTKLVRVVVLKPLCGQMFQTLVQRLGGLVNRRIFYMPFSRKLNLSSLDVKRIHSMFEHCRSTGAILVVQPEHILSFKLLGLERLYNAQHRETTVNDGHRDASEQTSVAQLLIDTQLWLKKYSRDILDESDEILSSRHELIYTIGNSKPIQHHPQRWLVVQEILTLVEQTLKERREERRISPHSFEIEQSKYSRVGGFDSIRILDLAAGRELLESVAKRIIASQLPIISFRHWNEEKQGLATKFITKPKLSREEIEELLTGDSDLDNTLLLLRGLIAHNILLFALHEKRWKVDYGLDLKRSMLAVPYRAKDSPSGQSEFSHPDVALTLTCLSYYYGGLTENQLELTFRTLFKTDNPALEYERWWKRMTCTENYDLKHLNAVNLEDMKQWKDRILPTFRFNKEVIDFYLSRVVFPLEAKEFEHKLSSSGWDIAERKTHPTTGFSGTNDNRFLLPLSITQHDTDQQLNTNASVLSYILQDGNRYVPIKTDKDTRLGTVDLLKRLATKYASNEIHVLLDVGAQVLELNNEEVAQQWLRMVSPDRVRAAVYFNEDDELTVLTREGVKEPVMISAFAERLDNCVVYLDEAHTRGTDLKLPPICRAAVTLGPNLTKDRLVQACMRMRKLGNGHSVLFCGPPEIDRELRNVARRHKRDRVEVRDVIHWSMQQTCHNTRKLVPIWAKQGVSHRQRSLAMRDSRLGFPEGLLEQEAKTLNQHYGFERSQGSLITWGTGATDSSIKRIVDECTKFGVKSSAGAPMLEEQERELCHEIECERETERPPPAEALKHRVLTQVRQFIETGKLPPASSRREAFIPAFEILSHTAAAEHFERGSWPQDLLATADFANTVEKKRNKGIDDYLMPVNWVISSGTDPSILVILSQWEVNNLLTRIRVSKSVRLHMFVPRATKASPSYNRLDYYTLPPVTPYAPLLISPHDPVIDLLSLFSGQLYFHDYASYERICGFLGLYFKDAPAGKGIVISPDGHVKNPDARRALGMPLSPFERSPLPLLRVLVGLRRKGQSYLATHVGCMLHGRQLREQDVEEVDEEQESEEVSDVQSEEGGDMGLMEDSDEEIRGMMGGVQLLEEEYAAGGPQTLN
ncbi:hypothetical protein BDZ91DRAFT_851880 [Kalaharituber pfeilii]|nr:hypothetical protein BDZ91DRAFT_851880 [Kalaharituber pfeilii]